MNKLQHTSLIWRWVTLAAVLINIFFNYYLNANPINGQTMGMISNKYPTLITPAGYAFSIWGVIYLSFIIYAIYQLLPSQRNNQVYNHLTWPLIATSMLSITWLICFSFELMGLSVLIITCMLLTAILLFGRAKEATFQHKAGFWLTIPFGLYMGWLSVATITNIAVWLTDIGWQGGTLGEVSWTVVMIGVALTAGILISFLFKDITYPVVISWATFAIYGARQNENESVAIVALFTAILLALWAAGYGIWLYRSLQPKNAWQHELTNR